MLDSMTPIVRAFPNRETIRIHPISDLHLESQECMEERFAAYLKKIAAEPNDYIVLGGDELDNATKNGKSNVYASRMRPREAKERLAKLLEPVKDRIIAAVPGNHEGRSERDVDDSPLYDVLCKLDIEDVYRPEMAFMFLRFGDMHGDGRSNPTYKIALVHGSGGGEMIGGYANKAARFSMSIEGLDVLILGHSHKPMTFPVGRVVPDPQNNRITQRDCRVVISTSWLSYGGYPLTKIYAATSFCPSVVTLCGMHKEVSVTQ